jgi:hypothetical protein
MCIFMKQLIEIENSNFVLLSHNFSAVLVYQSTISIMTKSGTPIIEKILGRKAEQRNEYMRVGILSNPPLRLKTW